MRAAQFDRRSIVNNFIQFASNYLQLVKQPNLNLVDSPAFCLNKKTFGMYEPEHEKAVININERNLVDVLRTVAHELVHAAQHQGTIDAEIDTGLPGKEIENVANALAGVIVKNYTDRNPRLFGMTAE